MQTAGERDWGKAEACGLILSIPLYHTTFSFPTCNLDGSTTIMAFEEEDEKNILKDDKDIDAPHRNP